jgi:glutathione S-transferase
MAEYTLYCFAQSGNCYKAALALELAGADWAPRFVDFFNGESRTPEFRAINVMGEAPVLEHHGLRMTQSGVILDYLAGRLGRFGGNDEDEKREILRWILFDNHKFTSYTATYRFLRTFAKAPDPAVLSFLRARCESAWSVLDAHLAGRRYVVDDRLTIADLSLVGYVYFDDEIGVDWAGYPNIDGWRTRIAALPGWQHPYRLMPGHPLPAAT